VSVSKTYAREVTVELVLECCVKVAIEKAIAVLMDHPQAVRTVAIAVRHIAILIAVAMGGI